MINKAKHYYVLTGKTNNTYLFKNLNDLTIKKVLSDQLTDFVKKNSFYIQSDAPGLQGDESIWRLHDEYGYTIFTLLKKENNNYIFFNIETEEEVIVPIRDIQEFAKKNSYVIDSKAEGLEDDKIIWRLNVKRV